MRRWGGLGKKWQRGDTLVEVLICVMIVSLILGGAYVTTHRSSLAIRNSQEHSEALKLVQAQLEQLRENAGRETTTVFTGQTPFCMIEGDVVNGASPSCKQNSSGQQAESEPVYTMTIDRRTVGNGALFAVKAEWASIRGGMTQETIYYRLYP
jgi:prepilin-type N-terminal cleavage/methylation domain-containing protein